jgi:hypothetical protein
LSLKRDTETVVITVQGDANYGHEKQYTNTHTVLVLRLGIDSWNGGRTKSGMESVVAHEMPILKARIDFFTARVLQQLNSLDDESILLSFSDLHSNPPPPPPPFESTYSAGILEQGTV